eukprot:CAMPEP_0172481514 /NCGR_PEP_ID=MMETSP1066-20121228/7441_1 /TAXON_ID=671091 /ORGANISM="Coscinodiscus wailesii, Strain CCMP2513" /LENGTH=251 /DNA_ID=CAMNT_0013243877 /DNA_START=19 /DNA_END=774 /DNA_ORIENTATION=+
MTNKLHITAKNILPSFGSNKVFDLISREEWEHIEHKCESNSRNAKMWSVAYGFYDGEGNSRLLPLHFACSLHPPVKTLESIIRAYPEGVNARESAYDRLPLHIACLHNSSSDVIQLLLRHGVTAAGIVDADGRLPLHYALSNAAPFEVIKALVTAYPQGVRVADSLGWLPIHVACCRCASLDVVTVLLGACPTTAALTTDKGRTPAMLAKRFNRRNGDEVADLLEASLDMAKAKRMSRIKEIRVSRYAKNA